MSMSTRVLSDAWPASIYKIYELDDKQLERFNAEITKVVADVLTKLTAKNESESKHCLNTSFTVAKPPSISLLKYFTRIQKYLLPSNNIEKTITLIGSLILIDRYMQNTPKYYGASEYITSLNVHRLILLAFSTYFKFHCDSYYDSYCDNTHIAKVGGIPTAELNALELDFLFTSNFSLQVKIDTFSRYYEKLYRNRPLRGIELGDRLAICTIESAEALKTTQPTEKVPEETALTV